MMKTINELAMLFVLYALSIPDNYDSQVIYDYEEQVIALQTTEGFFHDHHAYHCEDQCVGKIS